VKTHSAQSWPLCYSTFN